MITHRFTLFALAARSDRPRTAWRKSSLIVMALLCIAIAPAFGQLAGTATIFATPNGPNFNYTISLTNTGTMNIGTFWFAWTPPGMPTEYDFLPSAPFSISQPTGWLGPASPGFPGYSIEYYNSTGSLIAPKRNCHVSVYQPRQPYDASRFYIRISEDHFVYLLGQSRGRAHSQGRSCFCARALDLRAAGSRLCGAARPAPSQAGNLTSNSTTVAASRMS